MKTRVKRLLLTTGVLGSVAVPFGTVISCSKSKKNEYVETPYTYSPFYAIDEIADNIPFDGWNMEANFDIFDSLSMRYRDKSLGHMSGGWDAKITPGIYIQHVSRIENINNVPGANFNNNVYKHNFNNKDYSDEILHSMLAQYGGYGEKYFKEIKTFVNNYFACKLAPELAMSYYNGFNEPDFSKVHSKKIFINSIGGPIPDYLPDLFKSTNGVVTENELRESGVRGAELKGYSGPQYGSLVLNQTQYGLNPKAMFGLIPKFADIPLFSKDFPSNWYEGFYPQEVINHDNVGETYRSYSDQKVQEMFEVAKKNSSKETYDAIKAKYDNKTISNIDLLRLMVGNFDLKMSGFLESISWGIKIIDAIKTNKLIELLKTNDNEVYLYGQSYGWANYAASMLMKPSIVKNANKISLLCNHFSEAVGGKTLANLCGGIGGSGLVYKEKWSKQEFEPNAAQFKHRTAFYVQEKYGELDGFRNMFLKDKGFLNQFQNKVFLYNASNDQTVGRATQRELSFYNQFNLRFSIYNGHHTYRETPYNISNYINF